MKIAAFTVDLEQDCPPFLDSVRGMQEGLPKLLGLFETHRVVATFFCTGNMAERFPEAIREILQKGHELGCHGLTHTRFDTLSYAQAEYELRESSRILTAVAGPIVSFRAPNLSLPDRYLTLLRKYGFSIDSSIAKYKPPYAKGTYVQAGLLRIPASVTSSVLRLPTAMMQAVLRRLTEPVLFVHPWEFTDMSKTGIRYDCRFNTGAKALSNLDSAMRYFKEDGYQFRLMRDFRR